VFLPFTEPGSFSSLGRLLSFAVYARKLLKYTELACLNALRLPNGFPSLSFLRTGNDTFSVPPDSLLRQIASHSSIPAPVLAESQKIRIPAVSH